MRALKTILIGLMLSTTAVAANDPAMTAESSSTSAEDSPSLTSAESRDASNVTLSYTIFSTGLILPKRGPALSYISSRNWTFELEYLKGDVGLGYKGVNFASFEEELLLGQIRYYGGNLFNVFFGFGERRYTLDIGSDRAETLAPDAPNARLLEVRNQVIDFGIGNRWQWEKGFTFGIDWLALIIPVGKGSVDAPLTDYIEDDDYRENTRTVLRVLRYIPTVTAFKAHLGWTF